MRPIAALAALAALLFPLAVCAEECPNIFSDQVPWVPWRDFFAKQPFGTIGFTRNDELHVYVPEPGVECVTVPGHTTLHVLFNHRNTGATETGYVSFKAYGLLAHAPQKTTLLIRRSGDWTRDNVALKPFEPPAYAAGFPGRIPQYETFYRENGQPIDSFDHAFGPLHGTPRGSDEFSWDGRLGMQPDRFPNDRSVGYVMHVLARVQTQAGVVVPGDPPAMDTTKLDLFRDMLVTVSSPLGEGYSKTLRFRE
jgi:hypothetical protein